MKKYVSPVAVENDMLAEAIYAASGDVPGTSDGDNGIDYNHDGDCWSISASFDQIVTPDQNPSDNNWATVRVQCDHPADNLQHISGNQEVVLTFNQPIASASFDSGSVVVDGCTVTAQRALLGDAYNSGDNFNAMFRIQVAGDNNIGDIQILDQQIYCTHETNVQGGFD